MDANAVVSAVLTAAITGTVIGAFVTGAFSLAKPWIDFWVTRATQRWTQKLERRVVVEGVVERLRKLRVAHQAAQRKGENLPYELVLEAADSALLIHDQEFAKYLSTDIENIAGFRSLCDWHAENGVYEGEPRLGAQLARWEHLKELVARSSEYAVTGKWKKEWAESATKLKEDMDEAAEKVHNP